MTMYEIAPEMKNQEVFHNGITLPMSRELYPTYFRPGVITRIGETALLTDQEEIDLIQETFGPLEV